MTGPKRTRQHVLETESRKYFEQNIPNEWVIQGIDNDYGIDNHVEIVENEELDGNFFSIQLKGTDGKFEDKDYTTVQMRTSTIYYLLNRLELVMIILFVSRENEAYWIWLRNAVNGLDWEKERFTVKIPKRHRLSTINWDKIREFSDLVRQQKVDSAMGLDFDYEN